MPRAFLRDTHLTHLQSNTATQRRTSLVSTTALPRLASRTRMLVTKPMTAPDTLEQEPLDIRAPPLAATRSSSTLPQVAVLPMDTLRSSSLLLRTPGLPRPRNLA
jgi:hypothetical protein